jgi:predicted esterase
MPKSSHKSRWALVLGLLAWLAHPSCPGAPALAPLARATQKPEPFDVPVPGDRPLRVALAEAGQDQAIVYLHGMCGAEKGADVWADLATAYGTVITLRADVPCDDRPGYKWPKEPSAIQARVAQALAIVGRLRRGDLALEAPILIGYSQGAHRAERLAAEYPQLYRTLALGGPPTAASPDRLRHARRVAILGGELEDTSHMIDGYLALQAGGIDTEFFTLPRAGHGGYGPEGRRVMTDVLAYLFR